MKHKTMFRLLLKAVGVLLFVQGVAVLISQMGWMLNMILQGVSSGGGSSELVYSLVILGYVFQAGVGLYLFFDGKWVVNKAIPSNRPYCHECGYELTGVVGDACPECGQPLDPRLQQHRQTAGQFRY
jgi:predicted RNA-binding Zn-ribbon protein involved in translation (DUF1610 family)